MTTGPTVSGIPTAVAPLPAGALVSHNDLVRASGAAAHEFEHAIRDPQCPTLPHAFLMGGAKHYDSSLVQAWLREFAAFRQGLPALEKFRAQERAKAQHESRMRKLHEEEQRLAMEKSLSDMRQQHAAELAAESEGAAPRDNGGFVPLAGGGSV